MKALTLHQPWATLIAIGAKQYETRSWPTSYRGPLAIHAGKNTESIEHMAHWFKAEKELDGIAYPQHGLAWWFRKAMIESGRYGDHFKLGVVLPRGAIVCTCDLVDIKFTDSLIDEIGAVELAFGDWSPGRYAWRLANVQFLDEPIPARGYQGLWDWQR